MSTPLLIGSCEPFSGKSAVVLGLARQLSRLGIEVMYGKPLATLAEGPEAADSGVAQDPDVPFISSMLGLEAGQILPSVQLMESTTAELRLRTGDLSPGPGLAELQHRVAEAGDRAVLLEATGSLSEGLLYGLGLAQLAEALEAVVVLVHPWADSRSVDALLAARHQLGERLVGVVLNGVPPEGVEELRRDLEPALGRLGIPVLGVMPRSPLLHSVTVEELGRRLQARVLCCRERLDL